MNYLSLFITFTSIYLYFKSFPGVYWGEESSYNRIKLCEIGGVFTRPSTMSENMKKAMKKKEWN